VVVVLPDPFRGIGARKNPRRFRFLVVELLDSFQGMGAPRNSTEKQQFGHAPRSGPEIINGSSSAKDGAPERVRYGTDKEEMS